MEKKEYHFSHPHPLKLIIYEQTLNNLTSPCSACKLKPSGVIYACTICQDYFLHKKCFEMPKRIDHLCHKKHSLTLLSKPSYLEDHFACDACGENGDGFSYNCSRCDVDLHLLCVLLPLFVKHESHVHKLDLTFQSPYPSKSFSCAICGTSGSRYWLYRCKLCEFNAHLNCARGVDHPPIRPPVQPKKVTSLIGFDEMSSQLSPKAKEEATCSRSIPSAPELPPVQQQQPNIIMPNSIIYGIPSSAPVPPPFEVNRQVNNEVALQVVKQMIINNIDAIAQAILFGRGFGGGLGGGGYGGNVGLNRPMHLMSNSGVGGGQGPMQAVTGSLISTVMDSGGGGGGGINPMLNFFGGGDGGGQASLLAAAMGGGGDGGGVDPVQYLLGDDNGVSFLSGLFGSFAN